MAPFFEYDVQLERFPGKGGWTYARLPGVKLITNNPFGWRRVKGYVDNYEINSYHLMPMGNGELFLPVKAQIRKLINKHEGDYIFVQLFDDVISLDQQKEFEDCLSNDPDANLTYNKMSQMQKNNLLEWIYSSKTDQIKLSRIVKSINVLASGNNPISKI